MKKTMQQQRHAIVDKCRQPTKCPLDWNCLSSWIIYKAALSLVREQV